jgi:hypothetical protein
MISGAGMLAFLAVLVWRERDHRLARGELAAQADAWRAELAARETELAQQRELGATLEGALAERESAALALRDRVANLEAQRDHLRAEAERHGERVRRAEQGNEDAQLALQACRRELLEQSALPRELRAQLDQARAHAARLEEQLDGQAASGAAVPTPLAVAGVSGDRTVFAVSGELGVPGPLPVAVYLCRKDRIILEGWLHRLEGGKAIGHVARWHDPASTLVNGEKVFILPRQRHEAD